MDANNNTGTGSLSKLYIVRHGETEWSLSGRHTGRTDVPLTQNGVSQAGLLAGYLSTIKFSWVASSPLARARETSLLAGFSASDLLDDLMEWDYGEYEGLTTADIQERRPGWMIWDDGASGGEMPSDVGRRADRVIEQARSAVGDTICFAHGHLLRVLAARWLGLPPASGRLLVLDPGSVSVLGWERDAPVVVRWNEQIPPRPE